VFGALFVALAGPAGAAKAKGCSGSGTSFDKDDVQVDTAAAPGRGGTKANPFDVTTDGRVQYEYSIREPGVAGGKWEVKLDTGFGLKIPFSGKISRTASASGQGVEPLKKHLQFGGLDAFLGLVKVDIVAKKGGTTCTVSGYLKIHADIFTTPAFYLALILLILGILLGFLAMGA
jgi:hypothetical protein